MMLGKKLWADRFSNLPDKVAHHILSFLSFKELARVGIVSKRCREFYLSIPSVNLDARTNQKRAESMSFWDRYMFHRGDKKMQRFYIEWRFSTSDTANKVCDEHFRIITWIYNAVRCKVEELDLNFTVCGMTTFALPSCLYQSQYLKSLILKCSYEMTLKVPSSSSSSLHCNLRYLQLSFVKIVDERISRWISCYCIYIKELQLIQVKGLKNITIKSFFLESFKLVSGFGMDLVRLNISGRKLENIDLNWSFDSSSDNHSLNIDAPNLKALKWVGQVLNSQNLGKLMNLQSAFIFLQPEVNDDISEVFGSICRTKILALNENTVKAMFRQSSMQSPLNDILRLSLQFTRLSNDLVPIMISLLRGMCNLNILVISSEPSNCDPLSLVQENCDTGNCMSQSQSSSGFDMGYWKLQDLTFVYQLQELTIDLTNGSNEIEFAKYVLENAPNLRKIVIRHRLGSQKSDIVVGKVTRCKVISRAIIVIQEY